jgi:hypothetical protein
MIEKVRSIAMFRPQITGDAEFAALISTRSANGKRRRR